MSKFEKSPVKMFEHMTYGAGVVASNFAPETGTLDATDILFGTTGGNTFAAPREFIDMGEDIDNCPEGSKQLQKAKPYKATLSGTGVSITKETLNHFFGSGDLSAASNVDKYTPRNEINTLKDFTDIWLICDYSADRSEENGGFVAIHLMNAMNVDGFSGVFTKNKYGEFAYNFQAFYDLENMDTVPFEVYIKTGGAAA